MFRVEYVRRFETLKELANVNEDILRTFADIVRTATSRLHGIAKDFAHMCANEKSKTKIVNAHTTLGYAFGEIETIRDLCDELLQKYAEQ